MGEATPARKIHSEGGPSGGNAITWRQTVSAGALTTMEDSTGKNSDAGSGLTFSMARVRGRSMRAVAVGAIPVSRLLRSSRHPMAAPMMDPNTTSGSAMARQISPSSANPMTTAPAIKSESIAERTAPTMSGRCQRANRSPDTKPPMDGAPMKSAAPYDLNGKTTSANAARPTPAPTAPAVAAARA